jgi:hypothetical protein
MKLFNFSLWITLLLVALPASAFVTEDTAATAPGDGLGQPPTIEKASVQAQSWLAGHNLTEGYHSKSELYIAIGESTIAVGPEEPAFGIARTIAFEEAGLKAKSQLASFIAAEIKRSISSISEKPNRVRALADGRAKIRQAQEAAKTPDARQLSMIEKAKLLAHGELNTLMVERGVAPEAGTPDAAVKKECAEAVKELLGSKSFSDAVELAARTEAAGMRFLCSFEAIPTGKRGSIAVVGSVSKASREMAQAMLGKGEGVVNESKKRESVANWLHNQGGSTLLYSHGVLQRYDENGELWLVSFGQATPEHDDEDMTEVAQDEAYLSAMAGLRSFAGEMVSTQKRKSTSLDTKTFAAEGRKTTKEFANSSSYRSATTAIAESLRLPGTTTLYRWEKVHPLLAQTGVNIPTVGVVVGWNVSSAEAANELGTLLTAIGGSQGGQGRQPVAKTGGEAGEGSDPAAGGSGKGTDSLD